jgi:hypothetical protein
MSAIQAAPLSQRSVRTAESLSMPAMDVRLSHGFALSYGYKSYFADSAGTGYSSSLAQVSLKWVSNSGKIFQSR